MQGLDRKGLLSALGAYAAWGLLPLYWKLLSGVEPLQILCCRIVFSLILVWALLALRKRPLWTRVLKDGRIFLSLLFSSAMIGLNWGLYIWAVNSGHTVDASLGYYINPLVSVFLGLFFFRERLSPLQWLAVVLAAAGVIMASVESGFFPWIAVALALSFGFYGLAKKKLDLEPMVALGAETLLLAPMALGFLAFRGSAGTLSLFSDPLAFSLLAFAGVVTTIPLLAFSVGAKRLPLSTLGFAQYVSPTIQLLLGVFVFHEAFSAGRFVAFALVWLGLAVYSVSILRKRKA